MKYRIDLAQGVIEGATLFIEADNQEAAEELAMELAATGKDQNGEPFIWKFVDVDSPFEIIGAEEWPPVNDPDPELQPNVIDLYAALKRTEEQT